MIIDLRGKIKAPTRFGTFTRTRPLLGVTLHRTAGIKGEHESDWHNESDPSQTLSAHIGVTMGGNVFLLQPFELGIWHAEGLSPCTIGIELEGNGDGFLFPNGTPYYWKPGGGPHDIPEAMLSACDELFDFILAEFDKMGIPWLGVYAHRQADADRECDPGRLAWELIGVPWRQRLNADPAQLDWTCGTGRPIPHVWDPASKHKFGPGWGL